MGLFSFGGSSSRSQSSGFSQSNSFSRDEAGSFDRATSGSESGGFSRAGSRDTSRGASRQSIAFEDVFARLFGNAESVAASLDPSALTEASNQLFSGGLDFLSDIGGDAGTAYALDRLAQGNPVLQEQIDLLGKDITETLNEDILTAIRGDAVAAGTLGGARQGVAEGEAAEAALESFSRGAASLRSQDIASRDAIAQSIAERDLSGRSLGASALPQFAGIAEMGFGAQFEPIARLASVLGDPTVLTQSDQSSFGTSFSNAEDFARAFSESFGTSFARGRSGSSSRSRTQSSSSSRSLNLGFI